MCTIYPSPSASPVAIELKYTQPVKLCIKIIYRIPQTSDDLVKSGQQKVLDENFTDAANAELQGAAFERTGRRKLGLAVCYDRTTENC